MELNRFHRQLLNALVRGADVFDRRTAGALRLMASEGLVAIVKENGDYGPRERHPYFGAITTEKGLEAARGGRS